MSRVAMGVGSAMRCDGGERGRWGGGREGGFGFGRDVRGWGVGSVEGGVWGVWTYIVE